MKQTSQIISYSELDAGRQCPFKHLLAYKERWSSTAKTSPALAKGTLWHLIMEVHYVSLRATQDTKSSAADRLAIAQKAVEKYINENMPHFGEYLDVLVWAYLGYCEKYGADTDWRILEIEYAPEVQLPNPSGAASQFVLKAKIDLIVEWRGKIMIVDHKFVSSLPTSKDLDLDDQFTLYQYLLEILGYKVFGVLHSASKSNKLKTKEQTLEDRFLRTPMARTPQEVATVAKEAYWSADMLYNLSPETTPRNTNPDTCSWKCNYTEPCLLSRKGLSRPEAMRAFGLTQNFERH